MGETWESEIMGSSITDQAGKMKERRNGMWNIFDGVAPEVLEKLGLTERDIHPLIEEVLETEEEYLQIPESLAFRNTSGFQRSLSASVENEVGWLLRNRKRRNALGNLFEILSPSQQALLVEHLQMHLEKLSAAHAVEVSEDNSNVVHTDSLPDAASSSMTTRSTSVTQGHIVCH